MKVFAPHMVDVYKLNHAAMYTEGTDFLYSNLTPRSDHHFKGGKGFDHKMVVFGTQGSIMEIVEDWNDSFFSQQKEKVIRRYTRRLNSVLGNGVVSPARMAALHDIGYLPLEIKTIDEGARIGMKIPMLTINNTLPEFFWLVNYLETALSAQIWQMTTNATIAYEYKRILVTAALRTGAAVENVMFQGHDFSLRGMPGYVAGARSGSGHLSSFSGTDSLGSIDYIEDYYGEGLDLDSYFIAGSIPATEHAVSSSNILTRAAKYPVGGAMTPETNRLLAEKAFLLDYITRQNLTGFCSYVADTYDYWKVLTEILPDAEVKAAIIARDGRLVIRPDSGDPLDIICGDDNAHEGSPEHKGSIQILWEIFGGTVNEAGFKELDSHIGLIYGDSITLERADKITRKLEAMGFASTNVVFGIGSYTYQCNTRDTFGTAMKATATSVNGEFFEIYKDPATGDKLKQSAKGLLYVGIDDKGEFFLLDRVSPEKEAQGELKLRYKDGKFFNVENIDTIRKRLI